MNDAARPVSQSALLPPWQMRVFEQGNELTGRQYYAEIYRCNVFVCRLGSSQTFNSLEDATAALAMRVQKWVDDYEQRRPSTRL